MSGLIGDLTGQTFVMAVMLTGHIQSYWNIQSFRTVVYYQHAPNCFAEIHLKWDMNHNCLLTTRVLKCKLLISNKKYPLSCPFPLGSKLIPKVILAPYAWLAYYSDGHQMLEHSHVCQRYPCTLHVACAHVIQRWTSNARAFSCLPAIEKNTHLMKYIQIK